MAGRKHLPENRDRSWRQFKCGQSIAGLSNPLVKSADSRPLRACQSSKLGGRASGSKSRQPIRHRGNLALDVEDGRCGAGLVGCEQCLRFAAAGDEWRCPDPSAFAGLAVGVNTYSTQAAGPSTGSFNGGQTYQNEVYIEGLPLTSAGTESDTRNLAFGVSVEAVDQFQVETSGAKAMYEGQGVANYVFKSGTNQFHGGVFEYFRNTDFDARGFFALTTPIEHQNEFGATISGPIKKNKLFFFGNYDGYRFDSATPPGYQSIPTAAERGGDFSAFRSSIYDPTSATRHRSPYTVSEQRHPGKPHLKGCAVVSILSSGAH